MKSFFSLLKSQDLFKKPFFLRISQQDQVSSYFGVLISFFIYGLLLFQISQSDVFRKLSPKLLVQTIEASSRPRLIFSNQTITISLVDVYGIGYVDPTMFTVTVKNIQQDSTSNITSEKTLHLCQPEDMMTPEDLDEYYLRDSSFCLDNRTFGVEGFFNEGFIDYLIIELHLCQNSSFNNNSCASYDQMLSFLKGKYFQLIHSGNVVQTQNYAQPLKRKYQTDVYMVDVRIQKIIYYTFQQLQMTTDDGFLLSNLINLESFLFQKKEVDLTVSDDITAPVLTLSFYSSDQVLTIQRIYQSLPEALAVLGGLFTFLHFCGGVFCNFEKKLQITMTTMNYLYRFQTNNYENKQKASFSNWRNNERNMTETHFEKTIELKTTAKNRSMENIARFENENKPNQKDLDQDFFVLDHYSKEDEIKEIHETVKKPQEIIQDLANDDDASSPIKLGVEASVSPKRKKSFLQRLKTLKKPDRESKTFKEFVKISNQGKNLRFSLYEYFKLFAKQAFRRKKTFKEKLFLRTEKVFNEEIDVVQILKRIQDIDKLKSILLTPKQVSLFALLEDPIIFIDEHQQRKSLIHTRTLTEKSRENTEEAFQYYMELESNTQLGDLDRRLMEMVRNHIEGYRKYFGETKNNN